MNPVADAIQKLTSLCVWIAATVLFADDLVPDVPFVAGFDQFGRHADIDQVTAGRLLITELSCTACHATDDVLLNAKRGPVLDGVGSRLKVDWIRSFLLSPTTSMPGTTMPDMLVAVPVEQRESAADAITAFLKSLQQPFAEIKATGLNPVPMEFWNRGKVENGRRLYHQIGCVACHEPDAGYEVTAVKLSPLDELLQQLDGDELKEMGLSSAARKVNSVPHSVLAAKYSHQSLAYFLLNPEHTRPAGRMPNFSLLVMDAADIAAWLLRSAATPGTPTSSAVKSDSALIARGRQLFNELRCATCHTIQGADAVAPARPMATLDPKSKQTCVTAAADATAHRTKVQPKWAFDSTQISAINSAMAAVRNAAPAGHTETLSFHLLQQNCYACHERNRLGGIGRHRKPYFETVGHVDIGDEGRLPPALTGVGNRLTTSWLSNVLTGKGSIRPFMTIRMPVYPADVTKPLAAMFASADAGTTKPPIAEKVFAQAETKTLVEAGRQLVDTGCVQCHPFKGEAIPGTVGVDLEGVTQRVHPNWLHDFLKDPGSLKQHTRMPTFFPNGQSQNRDVLNGDVELQISAMHAYLKDLDQQPLPEKIQQARNQNYELTPTVRPIVLRTFMPVTGMHAIAVGFPQHVHFAFDAEHIALSQAWRGRFLDAEGTWFIRFAPPADPLGDKLINFPPGIAVALLKDKSLPWSAAAASAEAKFSGYRLDETGLPTFLYDVRDFALTDRIEPDEDNGLRRTITIVGSAVPNDSKQLWFRALSGKTLARQSPHSMINETGLAVTVTQPDSHGEIRTVGDAAEWIVPITINATTSSTVIKVEYRW